jgi:FixJ family two-component response regulator
MATSVAKPQRIIAIVDDDPGMQVSLSDLLGARGFKTSVFSSAEDWLDRGTAVRADCMLVDIWLGGISGIELQRRLRASGSTTPVIFMTARYDEATRSQALQAGGVSLLCKPFSAAQLIETIETATA